MDNIRRLCARRKVMIRDIPPARQRGGDVGGGGFLRCCTGPCVGTSISDRCALVRVVYVWLRWGSLLRCKSWGQCPAGITAWRNRITTRRMLMGLVGC